MKNPLKQKTPDYPVLTETDEPGQFYDGDSVPIHITRMPETEVRSEAAERVSYNTYALASGRVTQLAPYNPNRKQVQVFLFGLTGTPAVMIHYDPAQLSGGLAGGLLTSGNVNGGQFTFKDQRAIYATCGFAGGTASAAVIDEWYDNESDYQGK